MKLKQLREMLKPLALKVREAIIRRLAIARVISKGRVTVTDLQKINKSQLKTNNENIVIIPEVILQNESLLNFDDIWENSLPVVAKTLRKTLKLSEATDAGLNYIKETDWYNNLPDKTDFDKKYIIHLQGEFDKFEKECNENNI
ncbi:MAG: hypothetical protein ABIW47_11920 [Ginsengibacter sp.]